MRTITANQLKKSGITICSDDETLVLVRGKPSFVIIAYKKYEDLNEAAVTLAVAEAEAEYKAGKFVTESVEDHIKRIKP